MFSLAAKAAWRLWSLGHGLRRALSFWWLAAGWVEVRGIQGSLRCGFAFGRSDAFLVAAQGACMLRVRVGCLVVLWFQEAAGFSGLAADVRLWGLGVVGDFQYLGGWGF